jgi:hypothetical protein
LSEFNSRSSVQMVVALAESDLGRGGKFFRRRNRAAVVRAQIEAVIGRVLRNQVQLLHAVGNQRLRLGHDVGLLSAAMRAAHAGNDAEAARMVAALGDFDVGEMFGREAETRRAEIGMKVGRWVTSISGL